MNAVRKLKDSIYFQRAGLSLAGNLKLTDFGLASVFSHNGKRRALSTACGTPPYVGKCYCSPLVSFPDTKLRHFAAPEIRNNQYEAEPVDVWSAGVILYVMLSGSENLWGQCFRAILFLTTFFVARHALGRTDVREPRVHGIRL
jgi:serine/threonine protein kinase